MKIIISRLSEEEWEKYRDIRLEALKNDSIAFGSSFEEEKEREAAVWRSRIKDALFALNQNNEPVGLLAFLFNNRKKTKHRADIFSVYVKPDYRGKRIGFRLIEETLKLIKENKDIIKVNLTVNPLQLSAIKLYEAFGFKRVGTLSKEIQIGGKYYDEDLMELVF